MWRSQKHTQCLSHSYSFLIGLILFLERYWIKLQLRYQRKLKRLEVCFNRLNPSTDDPVYMFQTREMFLVANKKISVFDKKNNKINNCATNKLK